MGKPLDRSMLEGKCIKIFRSAVKSKWTLDPYERRLIAFLKWYGKDCDGFVADAKKSKSKVEQRILEFIEEMKERVDRKEITSGSISNHLKAIRLLLSMNDVMLNWEKIRKTLPQARRHAIDRVPTTQELRAIMTDSDIRGRALTLVFLTSGIREGSVESLKVRDLAPVERDGRIVAGKLVVYAGDEDQYFTFITAEAYEAVRSYLDFRASHGESVGPESPLFRDKFDPIENVRHRKIHNNHVLKPESMTPASIRKYYNYLFRRLGFRTERKKRHEFSVHGFRKWFKTTAERAGMMPIDVETLMGHSTGISDSYYRPTETDLLKSYLAISDQLAVTEAVRVRQEMAQQEKQFLAELAQIKQQIASLGGQTRTVASEVQRGETTVLAGQTSGSPRTEGTQRLPTQ